MLMARGADGIIVTGAETDVCVLATVLDAVDLGWPVYIISDGVCSSTDESHDAVLTLYCTRFYQQVQVLRPTSFWTSGRQAKRLPRILRSILGGESQRLRRRHARLQREPATVLGASNGLLLDAVALPFPDGQEGRYAASMGASTSG
jgi:hypothetical protein